MIALLGILAIIAAFCGAGYGIAHLCTYLYAVDSPWLWPVFIGSATIAGGFLVLAAFVVMDRALDPS